MFNYYQSISSSSKVLGSVEVEQFLHTIKEGNEYLPHIKKARNNYLLEPKQYAYIKKSILPCFSLNFLFNKIRSNSTIAAPTGYIYLDVDNDTQIDLKNPVIFSSWISLSGAGRGVIVRVENLDLGNFKYAYKKISEELEIEPDFGASKATQVNVLSHDPEIYINYKSEVLTLESTKDQYSVISNTPDTIGSELDIDIIDLRFDNLQDYIDNVEFNGAVIHDFQEKILFADAFLPFGGITEGKRNKKLSAYAYQIKAINPKIHFKLLYSLLKKANLSSCIPPLSGSEIRKITESVMKILNPEPIKNKAKRFVFNSDYELTIKEKQSEVAKIINAEKKLKSIEKIEKTIMDWDFQENGKITQKGIALVSKLSRTTVGKYFDLFKSHVEFLNIEFKKK